MIWILIFFATHWFLSVFVQSFFLHRYSSHKMFRMNRFWERFFYFFAFFVQGSSYLNPRAYAIIHRRHHAYSDTPKDPVSPVFSKNFFDMIRRTAISFNEIVHKKSLTDAELRSYYPESPRFERIADSWIVRISFAVCYILFYMYFVPENLIWPYFLLPFHFFMGPIQTGIVNWCGHQYGYRNYPNQKDNSRNTLPLDILILGEFYQNNHHARPNSPNFAFRAFELDLTFQVIRILHFLKIIRLKRTTSEVFDPIPLLTLPR
ncbi:fatty acid desaturase [Leptospira sp. SA-E8]|uniref:fatty acid desaturase n=1 Tax=Leptospira sp. SA-E8 TaxID=3422259 RepID=UPI003EBF2E96